MYVELGMPKTTYYILGWRIFSGAVQNSIILEYIPVFRYSDAIIW